MHYTRRCILYKMSIEYILLQVYYIHIATENKVVVKVADCHLISTRFGYALILDESHVVFLKSWQVSSNYYGDEVLLQRNFFDVKEWGDFSDNFGENPDNLDFNCWLETARAQDAYTDEEGDRLNVVKWEI